MAEEQKTAADKVAEKKQKEQDEKLKKLVQEEIEKIKENANIGNDNNNVNFGDLGIILKDIYNKQDEQAKKIELENKKLTKKDKDLNTSSAKFIQKLKVDKEWDILRQDYLLKEFQKGKLFDRFVEKEINMGGGVTMPASRTITLEDMGCDVGKRMGANGFYEKDLGDITQRDSEGYLTNVPKNDEDLFRCPITRDLKLDFDNDGNERYVRSVKGETYILFRHPSGSSLSDSSEIFAVNGKEQYTYFDKSKISEGGREFFITEKNWVQKMKRIMAESWTDYVKRFQKDQKAKQNLAGMSFEDIKKLGGHPWTQNDNNSLKENWDHINFTNMKK